MSDKILENLYYTESHEWLRLESDGTVTMGVTDHAQSAMGDMVFVDLPNIGDNVKEKGECGVLESVKSASDVYSPIAGEITEVNEKLSDTPDLVNKDCYGEGWIVKIKPENADDVKKLMDSKAYKEFSEKE